MSSENVHPSISQLKEDLLLLFNQQNIFPDEQRSEAAHHIAFLTLTGQPHAAIDYLVDIVEESTPWTAIHNVVKVLVPAHKQWILSQTRESEE